MLGGDHIVMGGCYYHHHHRHHYYHRHYYYHHHNNGLFLLSYRHPAMKKGHVRGGSYFNGETGLLVSEVGQAVAGTIIHMYIYLHILKYMNVFINTVVLCKCIRV
jgi:hypothetical protein